MRFDGEAAHHFQGSGGVLLPDGHPAGEAGLNSALSQHVGDREVLRGAEPGRRRLGGGRERLGRLVPDPLCRNGDDLLLGVAQRRQLAAEHATGVQAHRVVDPLCLRRRGVPVEHHRLAAIFVRPGIANGQAELVGLAGRVAVQRETPDPPGRAPVVGLLESGVRNDQLAVVEDQVGDEVVAELLSLSPELRWLLRRAASRFPPAHESPAPCVPAAP